MSLWRRQQPGESVTRPRSCVLTWPKGGGVGVWVVPLDYVRDAAALKETPQVLTTAPGEAARPERVVLLSAALFSLNPEAKQAENR